MADSLPKEIVTNILSRLLTESLSECSLVCKPWQNLIYNDKLFARMLSRQIYDHDSVDAVTSGKASFLYLCDSGERPKLLKYMEYDDENREKPLKFGINNLIAAPDHNLHEIIGSCNGLICISACSNNDPIYICNPMTREFVYLPMLTKKFRPRDYVVSGFGYDTSANEYKVVRIYFGRVYVYTLGSGKGWRTLKDIPYKLHPSVSNEIFANGALHWFDKDGKIVKFDLSDEKFSVIPTPKYVDRMWDFHRRHIKDKSDIFWDFELRVLGGCLRIIQRDSREYDIWSFRKKDYQSKNKKRLPDNENDNENRKQDIEESSWSWEQDTFDWQYLDSIKWTSELYPFAILKDNARILYHDTDCYYYRQNLASRRFKIIAGDRSPHDSVRYMKSFVSLKALGEKEAKLMK